MSTEYLGSLLNRVGGFIRAESAAALAPSDLSPRLFGVLSRLDDAGEPCTQAELGTVSRIDRTTMVAVVDDLESRQLVTRRRSARDRRAYEIALTAEGRDVVAAHRGKLREIENRVLDVLSPQESADLFESLSKIVSSLERHPGDEVPA